MTVEVNRNIDVDESEDDVFTGRARIKGWYITNQHATDRRYVKFYDATAANVTVGTTEPRLTIPVASGQVIDNWFGDGIPFYTAISVGATTGIADNNTGAPAANDVAVVTLYEPY